MLSGTPPNNYTVRSPNNQFTQLLGKPPNIMGWLGIGTTGGGVNLQPNQGTQNPISSNPNVAMMIRALMANRGGGL